MPCGLTNSAISDTLSAVTITASAGSASGCAASAAQTALDTLNHGLREGAQRGEQRIVVLYLDTHITRFYYWQFFRFISPRDYLKFGPYQKVWDELVARGLDPKIGTSLGNMSSYFGPLDMFYTIPCITCAIPK